MFRRGAKGDKDEKTARREMRRNDHYHRSADDQLLWEYMITTGEVIVKDRDTEKMSHLDDREAREPSGSMAKAVSRRDFLRIAGIAGATVGVGAGLGGLVAACGGEAETTTTTTAGATTTTAGATTTVSAELPVRPIKIGVTAPKTGVYAPFAEPIEYIVQRVTEVTAGGVTTGDGRNHAIEFVVRDTQSDSNRAAQVAGDMINNDKVDMILSSGSPDNVNPVADQCEALGTPSLSGYNPWQPFIFGRGGSMEQPFKWTYLHAMGIGEFVNADAYVMGLLETNKVVALLFANTTDGQAWADENTGYPAALKAEGYTVVMPSLYPPGVEDFTAQIAEFKKEGCEICVGTPSPAELSNFWKQAIQQGFNPKILCAGLAALFPAVIESIGPSITNCVGSINWHPTWPYKSSLSGETNQEFADAWEKSSGREWTQVLGIYQIFEWAIDVLKRTTDVDDKEAILTAIQGTKMETVQGPLDFTAALDPTPGKLHPHANVVVTPVTSGQWVKGQKWPFEQVQVGNRNWPDLPNTATLQPMLYS